MKPAARLCVLASGSGGNCSVLLREDGRGRHATLIDAGLSPRRTRAALSRLGLALEDVRDLILTHLDGDHWCESWAGLLPEHVTVRLHRRHLGRAARLGMLTRRTEPFAEAFVLQDGVRVAPLLVSHDDLGVAAFRFEGPGGGSLGFATDVGRATGPLIEHLRGVDVLAIESNYCPVLQLASPRPAFLKQRIMGGSGHLSNEQSARAVREIGPREHVVLLHLSRQCNRPELAALAHAEPGCALTISDQHAATAWIWIPREERAPVAATRARAGAIV